MWVAGRVGDVVALATFGGGGAEGNRLRAASQRNLLIARVHVCDSRCIPNMLQQAFHEVLESPQINVL